MKMQFKITFDPAYYSNADTVTAGTMFFSDANGYTSEDTGKVVMLGLNETILLDNNNQTVKRIK